MRDKFFNKIRSGLVSAETKFGVYPTAFLLALLLLALAAIYVTPSLVPRQLGRGYASLSANPFDFAEENYLRYRILTPLLAYCLGFRGSFYILFPLLIAVLFLSAIYFRVRKMYGPAEGLVVSMLICFSTPVLFLLHFQGYTDITSYLLIFLIMGFIRKPFAWIPLLALLLLNHASNLYAVPFLLFYYFIESTDKTKALWVGLLGMVIALLPFYFYRHFISSYSGVEYDFTKLLIQIRENVKTVASHFGAGVFNAFKLFWLIPVWAGYRWWKEGDRPRTLLLLAIIVLSMSQMLMGSDTSRFMGMAFPVIILGALKLREAWGEQLFLKRMFFLFLLNASVPQYYVGQSTMIRFYSLPASWLLKHVFGIETWVG